MSDQAAAVIRAVIGGQTGSECKGNVVYHLRNRFDIAVRVGGSNAGHVAWDHGRRWVFQSIPVGALNPECTLVIGAGAVVDPEQLWTEINLLESAGHKVRHRLVVDEQAAVITDWHKRSEGSVDGKPHAAIGSTGKGVGLARMSKLSRGAMGGDLGERAFLARDVGRLQEFLRKDTRMFLRAAHDEGARLLLEGTQGWGLSLDHGFWPYVTSANCGAAQLASDTGLPPQRVRCTVVARTYPIRVAGNSGPFWGHELSWEGIGVDPQSELTTVTKKVRRVAEWSSPQVLDAVRSNGADSVALMCLDQRFPSARGKTHWDELSPQAQLWVLEAEREIEAPICLIGTSPESVIDRMEIPE